MELPVVVVVVPVTLQPAVITELNVVHDVLLASVEQLRKKSVAVTVVVQLELEVVGLDEAELEMAELDEVVEEEELVEAGVLGSGFGGGPSTIGGGPEGLGQSPDMWMPNTLMHGKWKVGRRGKLGQSNSTSGISGNFQMIRGSQVGHGRRIGTIVVEESLPVVVSHSFPVIEKSVKASYERPGGTVVMVEVTEPVIEMTGPTVIVAPLVVSVVSVVIDSPKGKVRTVVDPSGSVSV